LHPNVQRLLRPIAVANNRPDADEDFPDHMTRTRRDHAKLLTLMDSIALLHQHQRKIKRDMRDGDTAMPTAKPSAESRIAGRARSRRRRRKRWQLLKRKSIAPRSAAGRGQSGARRIATHAGLKYLGVRLRDRAIMETLYSTGIRRGELMQLKLYDTDIRGGTLFIRQGKGKKDRVVPIGERAVKWIEKTSTRGQAGAGS
jgi:integrase